MYVELREEIILPICASPYVVFCGNMLLMLVLCVPYIIPTLLLFLQTYTGRILIAVNPFAKLPHMYDMHMMEQYRGVQFGELSPHVFAIADASYRYETWKPACSVLVRN